MGGDGKGHGRWIKGRDGRRAHIWIFTTTFKMVNIFTDESETTTHTIADSNFAMGRVVKGVGSRPNGTYWRRAHTWVFATTFQMVSILTNTSDEIVDTLQARRLAVGRDGKGWVWDTNTCTRRAHIWVFTTSFSMANFFANTTDETIGTFCTTQ